MTKSKTKQLDEVRGILAQLSQSGLSQREFAKREGVALSTLVYWLRRDRLARELAGEPEFVAVAAPSTAPVTSRFLSRKIGGISNEFAMFGGWPWFVTQ